MMNHALRLCFLLAIPAWAQTGIYSLTRPAVIVPGVTQNVIIEFRVTGTPPTKVFFEQTLINGPDVEMKDDGTGGDAVAGDGVFAVTVPAAPIIAATRAIDVFRPPVGFFRMMQGTTALGKFSFSAEIAPPNMPRLKVTVDSPDVQHTDYLVNIRVPSFFPVTFTPPLFADSSVVTRLFYQRFPDTFDFLAIVNSPSYFQNRFHFQTRNDVQGLGSSIFNSASQYGSSGALIGISRFPITSYFDAGETAFVHEAGHQWINYLRTGPASGTAHWPLSSLASGVMGFSIPGEGAGGQFPCTVTAEAGGIRLRPRSGNQLVFNEFDLYLMGLAPPDPAVEHYIFADQDPASLLRQCNNQLYPGAFTRLRFADLIASAGTRVPDAASSKKSFRFATILVTRDALLSPDEMAYYSYFARRGEELGPIPTSSGFVQALTNPFFTATGGRARINMQVTETPQPAIFYSGVANGSSVLSAVYNGANTQSVAPGSYVGIYGVFPGVTATAAPGSALPSTLAGVNVLVNGVRVPIYYADSGQVSIQLPFETALGLASVVVTVNDVPTQYAFFNVAAIAPGINVFGTNRAAVRNQDQSVNTAQNPAAPGSFISVYFTGIGPVDNRVATGQPAPLAPLSRSTAQSVVATIGGQVVPIQFCGLTPNFVGLAQANLQVPLLFPGDYPVTLTIGGNRSNAPLLSIGR